MLSKGCMFLLIVQLPCNRLSPPTINQGLKDVRQGRVLPSLLFFYEIDFFLPVFQVF